MTAEMAEPREPLRRHHVSGRSGLGLALTLTTVALWSVLPIGLNIALAGLDAPTLTWYRFVGAALVLGAALAAQGTRPRLASFDRRDRRVFVSTSTATSVTSRRTFPSPARAVK